MFVPATAPISLTTNVADLHGVGAKRASAFRKIGIRCVADLLLHLPSRYEHQYGEQTIAAASKLVGPAHGSTANLTVEGEVASVRPSGQGRRARF